MEKRKKLIGAKRTHRGKLEVRSVWDGHETIALVNSCYMMGYSDIGKYVHDLAAGTLTEMLKKALEEKNASKEDDSKTDSKLHGTKQAGAKEAQA